MSYARRGGRGRRGWGGEGPRGGGGAQRWWDPEWRKQELARRGAAGEGSGPRQELDVRTMELTLRALKEGPDQEIQVRENYGREGADRIHLLAHQAGLYSKSYGKGRRTVVVASKVPLPNFRPDLEAHREERQVEMDSHIQSVVASALQPEGQSTSSRAPTAPVNTPDAAFSSRPQPRNRNIDYPGMAKPKMSMESWEEMSDAGAEDKDDVAAQVHQPLLAPGDSVQCVPRANVPKQPCGSLQQEGKRLREQQERAMQSPKVQQMMEFRRKLPAFSQRAELLEAVSASQVVVVSGETGCGKTTQLPQFILEEEVAAGRGGACSIVCTQPRRISAISVAQRVADERGEALGDMVGYQIRLESKRSSDTRLMFCTSGVLLRRLAGDPWLQGVSHIVVDEIHERGMNEDFLLIVLRDLLPRRPDLRLILMSATLNAGLFCEYFGSCPRLHIQGFTFAVEDIFLEDVLEKTGYRISPPNDNGARFGGGNGARGGRARGRGSRPGSGRELEKTPRAGDGTAGWCYSEPCFGHLSLDTRESLMNWEKANEKRDAKLDVDLVAAVIQSICRNEPEGGVLVFMTGWDDISKLLEQLQAHPVTGNPQRCSLLPLHGSMPTANQRAIFERPPPGIRKVVLSTNIAETSITIDDIVYVVDGCKGKEKTYDPVNNLACLLPAWISKVSARQRRGRAGRVQAGKCFHLVPRAMHDHFLEEHQLPELLRTPLEELSLQIKALRLGKIEAFLSKALQPPDPRAVHNAVELLSAIGALSDQEELTPLGEHLAHLPVDPRIGKMMIMGAVFGCLEPVLIVAAGMAHRDPFVLPLEKKAEADAVRRRFAGGSCSDHIAILQAHRGWQEACRRGGAAGGREFCWRNFLSANTMQMMQDMVTQFADLLSDIGFLGKRPKDGCSAKIALERGISEHSCHQDDIELFRAVLCAGMFPSVASIRRRGKFNAFNTREDGKVEPHPSSVNSPVGYYPHRWLVYNDKVKTTAIYLRCSTMVPDYALLLFGGELQQSGGTITMLNGWMAFNASERVAELIIGLRQRLHGLLAAKVRSPELNIMEQGGPIVNATMKMLASSSQTAW